MDRTPLDDAHEAMMAAPENEARRLAFYDRLADTELFLLLETEPAGDEIAPRIFELEEGRFALIFDSEERLADFAEVPVPYAALPGRVIARELSGEGVGLGLNLGVAPSAFLMPPGALEWLTGTLDYMPTEAEARVTSFTAPRGLPEAVIAALDAKLSRLSGLARSAHLVQAVYADGRKGHLLAFIDARKEAEPALAKAVSEALVFSGVEMGEIDVTFFGPDDPASSALIRVALRFDLPEPAKETAQVLSATAPGTDPARPPKLR